MKIKLSTSRTTRTRKSGGEGMDHSKPKKMVKLDGRVGEGGGQVVRIAVALAALTGTPLRIENVRGNR